MSPEDWGASMPHKYLGGYRLGYDMQFTPEEKVNDDKETWDAIHAIYERSTQVSQFALESGKSDLKFNISDIT